eukprot:gene12151-5641_t
MNKIHPGLIFTFEKNFKKQNSFLEDLSNEKIEKTKENLMKSIIYSFKFQKFEKISGQIEQLKNEKLTDDDVELVNLFENFLKFHKEELNEKQFFLVIQGIFENKKTELWLEAELELGLYLANMTIFPGSIAIFEKLIEYYLEFLEKEPENAELQDKIISLFILLGRVHFLSKNDEKSEEYFQQAKDLQKTKKNNDINDDILTFVGYIYHAEVFWENKNLIDAEKYLKKATNMINNIRSEVGDEMNPNLFRVMVSLYSTLARLYFVTFQFEEALENSKEAMDIAGESKDVTVPLEANQLLIECYRGMHKYEEAAKRLEISENMIDALYNDERADDFMKNHFTFQHFDQAILVYFALNMKEKLILSFEDLMEFVKEKEFRTEDLKYIEEDYLRNLVDFKEISKAEEFVDKSDSKNELQQIYVDQLMKSDIEDKKILDIVLNYHEEGLSDYSHQLYDLLMKMGREEEAKQYKSTTCNIL